MKSANIAGASPDDLLLTELEVQDEFGIGIRSLRKWRHEGAGEGPSVTRIGRNCRYRRATVRDWISHQERGGGASVSPPPYGAFCEAQRKRDDEAAVLHGEEWDSGSGALIHALALRMAPTLERVFYRPRVDTEHDRATLAVVPFPAALLGAGAGVDLSSYLAAVDDLAMRHAGVIVAEPGHNWQRHIEEWDFLAPYMDAAPSWVTVYRADRVLRIGGVPVSGAVLSSGDMLERELKAAAGAVGLPFHVEDGDRGWQPLGAVVQGIVGSVTAQRDGAGA